MKEKIIDAIKNSINTKQKILQDENLIKAISEVATKIVDVYRRNGKVLLCGNGGSAADAQHIAAELSGKFYKDRPPLEAIALHCNTSYLTAVANDYSYDDVFARLVLAYGKPGDVLIGISTSGNSINVVRALQAAKNKNLVTIGFTGISGGMMKKYCDYIILVPSSETPRIQESHITIGHIICEIVENELFSS